MKNLKVKLFYYLIIVPLKCIFFFLMFERFNWYRKLKGGIWTNYFPKMYPYTSFWTRGNLYSHEKQCKNIDYGPIVIWDSVTSKKKKRKRKFTIED